MKIRKYLLLIAGIIIVRIVILLNPSEEEHKRAVQEILISLFGEELRKMDPVLTVFINDLYNSDGTIVSRENYILFSTTTITWSGKTITIGIGAFGKVWIYNEKEFKRTIKKESHFEDSDKGISKQKSLPEYHTNFIENANFPIDRYSIKIRLLNARDIFQNTSTIIQDIIKTENQNEKEAKHEKAVMDSVKANETQAEKETKTVKINKK
jgi:hypothetical protein